MSWECRSRLIKQRPVKPTVRRGEGDVATPGPGYYEQPTLYCGRGFSHIRRAPAYSFGLRTPPDLRKPAVLPSAPQLNCQGLAKKGPYHITHSVVSPAIKPLPDTLKEVPGPGQYEPRHEIRFKRPPTYSIRKRPRPPYQTPVMWSPPCNVYKPPLICKKEPAYSIQPLRTGPPSSGQPGPGDHHPNFEYVLKTTPRFSFGAPYRDPKPMQKPDPATYCVAKLGKTAPAPSFGIRHSPFIGVQKAYELPVQMAAIKEDVSPRPTL